MSDGTATSAPDTVTVAVDASSVPAIESVSITSTPTVDSDRDARADTYAAAEVVEVTVTWDAEVAWHLPNAGAAITVRLDVGSRSRSASLVTGGATSGTGRSLAFRYTVAAADADADGIAIGADALALAGGATLEETRILRRDALRAHVALAADANHRVDGGLASDTAAPRITGMSITSVAGADDSYGIGDAIGITAVFDEAVGVESSDTPGAGPRIGFTLGEETKYATYASGGGSDELVFSYTVAAGDEGHRRHRDRGGRAGAERGDDRGRGGARGGADPRRGGGE